MKTSIVTFLVLLTGSGFTQELKTKEFQVHAYGSLGLTYTKDQNYASFNWDGNMRSIGLQFDKIKGRQISFLSFGFTKGDLNYEDHIDFETDVIQGSLSLETLRNLANSKQLWIGLGYHFDIMYLDWNDQESFSFAGSHALKVAGFFELEPMRNHHLDVYSNFSILNFVLRPPYAGLDETLDQNKERPIWLLTNGRILLINQAFSYRVKVRYRWYFRPKWAIGLHVIHSFDTIKPQHQFRHASFRIGLLLTIKI